MHNAQAAESADQHFPGWVHRLIGRVKVVGTLPPGPVLLCSNHTSYRDVFIYEALRPGAHLLATPLVFSFPGLKGFAVRHGFVPVSIEAAVGLLKQGTTVAICPSGIVEGRGEDLLPFKTGAVRIAVQADVPVVPMYIQYRTYPGRWIERFSITTQNVWLFLLAPFYRTGATVFIGEPYRVDAADAKAATVDLKAKVLALRGPR